MTPEGWRITRLGDLLDDIEAGWSPQCDGHPADVNTWGVLKVSAVSSGTYISDENKALPASEKPRSELEVRNGDLLLVRANGVLDLVGRTVLVRNTRRHLMLSDKVLRLKPKMAVADAGFLNAFLGFGPTREALTNITGGSHMRNISQSALRELVVTCPPLLEQKRIASILLTMDDAIDTTRAVIDQLGVLKKALMAELLTRGIPGRHTKFKQTEIGEMPEGWQVTPLGNVAFVQTGVAKGKQTANGVEIPYLRVANVQDGHVDLSEVKTIAVAHDAVARYALQLGDVLFTEGGDADKLGRGCVWMGQINPCLHQNHVFAVRMTTNRLLPAYLACWAASPKGRSYFMNSAKQTTNLASINSAQLKAFPVAIPPVSEQEEIVSALGSIESRMTIERACYSYSVSLRRGLMSVLLTGDLRVPPAEDPT